MRRLDDVAADVGAAIRAWHRRRRAPRSSLWGGRRQDYALGGPEDRAAQDRLWARELELRRRRAMIRTTRDLSVILGISAREAIESLTKAARAFERAMTASGANEARRGSGLAAPPASPRRRSR